MPRVVVLHGGYGCDTGCCGHYIEVDDVPVPGSFSFSHPYGNEATIEWAREFVTDMYGEEHVADLDWDSCILVDD